MDGLIDKDRKIALSLLSSLQLCVRQDALPDDEAGGCCGGAEAAASESIQNKMEW